MRAAQLHNYGDEDAVKTSDQVAQPLIDVDQVLVEVKAAGVNPFDYKVREGYAKDMADLTFPATLGGDLAGVVWAVGEAVEDFSVGQEVFGQANALSGQGSFAEYAPVQASSLASKPQSVDFVTAAALPLVSVSAYQALIEHLNLQSGQKILIHGGAGGIGSIAIQLAKMLGAHVATTATGTDTDYVSELGADEVIDYTAQDFSELLADFDAVFDTVGGDTYTKSFKVLKQGGKIVSMVAETAETLANELQVTAIRQSTKVTTEKLTKIAEYVDAGKIRVNVDKIFSLDQAAEALEYLKTSHPRGKVVIKVND